MIEPALTPEDWSRVRLWNAGKLPGGKVRAYGAIAPMGPETKHAAAAIALHGQPFGFTWEDVDLLRDEVDVLGADRTTTRAEAEEVSRERDKLFDLADRLAALLPPRP